MGVLNTLEKSMPSFKKTSTFFATIVIPLELVVGIIVYKYILGDPSHFVDNNPLNHPLSGDILGMMYKGGDTVPVIITYFLVVLTFLIERIWTLKKARGNGNPAQFVMRLKRLISAHDIDAAKKECDLQQGSIASVLRAGLDKFQELEKHKTMDFDKKILSLQKELEDAADMELPMLEKNIIILSTIASLSTLTGLLGTVTGMVKAFAALAHSGAPDALGLATGISEALMSTALGMITSMLAIIFYSYVTTRIDHIMYHTAEAGQMVVRTFNSSAE